MKKYKLKTLIASAATVITFLSLALPVHAVGEVNTEKVNEGIQNIGNFLVSFVPSIFCVVIIIIGIACMAGGEGRRWAKGMALWGFLGFLLTLFAQPLVSSIQSFFA